MNKLFYLILIISLISCKGNDDETNPSQRIQQITNHSEDISYVSISPDGKTIYYTIQKYKPDTGNGYTEIYAVNSDGSNQRKILTYPESVDRAPVISKDGNLMAFSPYAYTSTGNRANIVVANTDGSNLRTIATHSESMPIYGFIENDNSILYGKRMQLSNCVCNTIWKIRLDGTEHVNISGNENAVAADVSDVTNTILVDTYTGAYTMDFAGQNRIQLGTYLIPKQLSPLGNSILLSRGIPTEGPVRSLRQLFIIDSNGSNAKQITTSGANNYPISYFPDGTEVLFVSIPTLADQNGAELYSVKLDGSSLQRLTNNKFNEDGIGFLEKKKKLLFASRENGNKNLFVLNLE